MVRKFAANTAAVSFVLAGAALVLFTPAANAVSYQTSGFSLSNLGDTLHTGYDYLTGTSVTGTLSDPSTITLNELTFTAGINATSPQFYTNKYSIEENITIDGGAQQPISIPFNLDISYSDTLTILATTFSFTDAAGTLWQFAVSGLTLGPNSGGLPSTGSLIARVTDPSPISETPLPAAFPLFASGLGAMGLFAWWRKRKGAAATTA